MIYHYIGGSQKTNGSYARGCVDCETKGVMVLQVGCYGSLQSVLSLAVRSGVAGCLSYVCVRGRLDVVGRLLFFLTAVRRRNTVALEIEAG